MDGDLHPSSLVLHPSPRAFAFIELMVVIGIIALLIAILLPTLAAARRSATSAATSATFGAISTALDAYHQDFQAYPPAITGGTKWSDLTSGKSDVGMPGFEALGIFLVGPGRALSPGAPAYDPSQTYQIGDCVSAGGADYCAVTSPAGGPPSSSSASWLSLSFAQPAPGSHAADGLEGPGIKPHDRRYGPYLQPGIVKMRGGAILDAWDNPIAYFPAHPGSVNIRHQVMIAYMRFGGYCDTFVWARYDALDNLPLFIWPKESLADDALTAVQRVQVMLGDTGDGNGLPIPDGYIDGSETPIADHPYLLWIAGPDGKFSVQHPTGADAAREAARCDDVTNFK